MDLFVGGMWELTQAVGRILRPEVPGLDFSEPFLEGALGRQLHGKVEGGIDAKALIEQRVSEPRIELFPHPLHEIFPHTQEVLTRTHLDRVCFPLFSLFGGEVALISHGVEHYVAMEQCVLGVAPGLVSVGQGCQRGQQRGFGNVDLGG